MSYYNNGKYIKTYITLILYCRLLYSNILPQSLIQGPCKSSHEGSSNHSRCQSPEEYCNPCHSSWPTSVDVSHSCYHTASFTVQLHPCLDNISWVSDQTGHHTRHQTRHQLTSSVVTKPLLQLVIEQQVQTREWNIP